MMGHYNLGDAKLEAFQYDEMDGEDTEKKSKRRLRNKEAAARCR